MVCLVEGPEICSAICVQYLKQSQYIGKLKLGLILLASSTAILFSSLRDLIYKNHMKRNPNNVDGKITVSGFQSELHEVLICDYQHPKDTKIQTRNLNLS
jgi:hypothetical protein